MNNASKIADFTATNTTDSFKFKAKLIGQTNNDGEINCVKIMIALKYLSNFWRTLEMPLINCEVELVLNWSANCIIISTNVANQNPTFTITHKSLCSSSYFINSR